MAIYHGKEGEASYDATSLGKMVSWTYKESSELADGTSMDDTEEVLLPGIKRGEGTITMRHDPDDPGQTAVVAGDVVTLILYPEGNTSGNVKLEGEVVVQDVNYGGEHTAVGEFNFTFKKVLTLGSVT